MAVTLLRLDKSAYVHGEIDAPADVELCLCAIIRLELLHSARSQRD